MHTTPQLRPLDLGDILDGTFRLYRNNFVIFLGVVALLQVPVALVRLVTALALGNPASQLDQFQGLPSSPQVPGIEWLAIYSAYANSGVSSIINLLNGFVLQPLIIAALVYAISRRYLNLPTTITDAVRFGARKLIYIIASSLLLSIGTSLVITVPVFCIVFLAFGLLLGAGFSAVGSSSADASGALAAAGIIGAGFGALLFVGLGIGMVWLYAQLAFYPQSLVVEGRGPIEALQRSWRLTARQRWRTTGIYFLLYLLLYVLTLILFGLFVAIALSIGVSLSSPLDNYGLIITFTELIQLLLGLLIQPFVLIGLTLLYYDLRVRNEGLDMELQAAAMQPMTNNH